MLHLLHKLFVPQWQIPLIFSLFNWTTTFLNSGSTIKLVRIIDRLFDILNIRNNFGKGFKQPLHPNSRQIWEEILTTSATCLLNLKTNNTESNSKRFVSHQSKIFIIGFVNAISSTCNRHDKSNNEKETLSWWQT